MSDISIEEFYDDLKEQINLYSDVNSSPKETQFLTWALDKFIKFGNDPKNTILDSMKEAGNIAKKYAPIKGLKIAGYSSRSGFMDSGLRPLITKNVQLGSPGVDPELTKKLLKL